MAEGCAGPVGTVFGADALMSCRFRSAAPGRVAKARQGVGYFASRAVPASRALARSRWYTPYRRSKRLHSGFHA